MADLPVGAYRGGSLDCQIIYDKDDLPIGFSQRGVEAYFPSVNTNQLTGGIGLKLANEVVQVGGTANSKAGRKVLFFSDSLAGIAETFGYPVTYSPAQAWLGSRSALETPTGGTGTLTYAASTKLMTYTAFGDSAGAPVDVSAGGVFVLRSANPDYWHRITVVRASLPASDFTATVTLGAATWQRTSGMVYLTDALTKHRFNIKNYGVPGDTAASAIFRVQQAINEAPSAVVEALGTNDVRADRTADQIVADRVAIWDAFLAAGIPVIACTLAARWGSGGDSGNYSAARQRVLAQVNKLVIEAANARTGVFIAECYSGGVDPTSATGVVKPGYTVDGLHPGSSGAQIAYVQAKPISAILNSIFPDAFNGSIVNAGQASQYDAVANPSGNLLLPAGVGSFAGTGGTAGTGVTVGTGLAAGLNASRIGGTAATAVANKLASTDGGPDWQEFVVTGSTDEATFRFYPQSSPAANFTTGDWVEMLFEVQIVGPGCTGVWMDLLTTGGVNPAGHRGYQAAFLTAGIQETMTMALQPQKWIGAGVTGVQPRLHYLASPTAAYSIRFRNWSLHKLIGYSYP